MWLSPDPPPLPPDAPLAADIPWDLDWPSVFIGVCILAIVICIHNAVWPCQPTRDIGQHRAPTHPARLWLYWVTIFIVVISGGVGLVLVLLMSG